MERREIIHTLVHNEIYYFLLPLKERLRLVKRLESQLDGNQPNFRKHALDWVRGEHGS